MNLVPHIAVVNHSTVVSDAAIIDYVAAQQHQVAYHFKPHWGAGASLAAYKSSDAIPSSSWIVAILDDSDQAGALGYHDLTAAGNPLAKVFAKTDIQYGYNWTITASHEVLEMLADPWIDCCVQIDNTTFYAQEVSDACEDDQFGYAVTGVVDGHSYSVTLSDFVFPHWFDGSGSAPYDYCKHITSHHQLLAGGYIGVWTAASGWTQKTRDSANPSRRLDLRRRKHSAGLKRSDHTH